MRNAELILLPDGKARSLARLYESALKGATELYIASAYLTNWETSTSLNPACISFRFVIGRDFGITKKKACRDVMGWLPRTHNESFVVADEIQGFHPKAMFWRDSLGHLHGLIGSSNLTQAAFSDNHEVNVYFEPTASEFAKFKEWVTAIKPCAVVSEEWLEAYEEAPRRPQGRKKTKPYAASEHTEAVVGLELPRPKGAEQAVKDRRKQLAAHKRLEAGLIKLFEDCAKKRISSNQFYAELPKHWSWKAGNRLQGSGWERKGKNSNFQRLSQSYIRIIGASELRRDDVVSEEIDRLARLRIPTRTSFLSEMLCLSFPNRYPVINRPVKKFISAVGYRKPSGASEGAKYIDLSKRLRMSIRTNPDHPAKSVCELDHVLWLEYGDG